MAAPQGVLRVRTAKYSFARLWQATSKMTLLLLGLAAIVVYTQPRADYLGAFRQGMGKTSNRLPPWSPGMLDIHHLRVGSSVSSFVVMPDGTTMLIDAGDVNVKQALVEWASMGPPFDKLKLRSPHPDDSKTPAEWIVDYMSDFWPHQVHPKLKLDYLLVTHFHADHVGDGNADESNRATSPSGKYVLSGVPELASKLPVRKIIDRGSSHEVPRAALEDASIRNYRQFAEENQGVISFEEFHVGSADQIKMNIRPAKHRDFSIRVIKCNLDVTFPHDPRHPKDDPMAMKKIKSTGTGSSAEPNAHGNENTMSAAIVIEYGNFRYYEGADQEIVRNQNGEIILDTIGPTAKAAGKVDVATLNHHGHGVSQDYITYIDPPIMILQGWSLDQPPKKSIEMLAASPFQDRGGGDIKSSRKIFATDVFPERLEELGPELSQLFHSTSGHVVVRVHPPPQKRESSRQTFEIIVLDGNREIKKHHGHFPVRTED